MVAVAKGGREVSGGRLGVLKHENNKKDENNDEEDNDAAVASPLLLDFFSFPELLDGVGGLVDNQIHVVINAIDNRTLFNN